MKLGAVIITMGNRPDDLRALLDSVAKQEGDPVEVVVVGNGAPVTGVPDGVHTIDLPENLGIPGGRNVGIAAFGPGGPCGPVDALLFLDDDGLLAHEDTAELVRQAFTADPRLGIISFRIADPETGLTQRRHVPRLRAADPMRSSRVTTFLGGANAVRTKVLTEVGDLPGEFFYAHEETDLAWRALDADWMIDYRSDMVLLHPTTPLPARVLPLQRGPQPGVAGSAQSPRTPRSGLSRCLAAADSGAAPLPPRPQGVDRRIPGRLGRSLRTATAHEMAYGVAADPTGTPARRVTTWYPTCRASGYESFDL